MSGRADTSTQISDGFPNACLGLSTDCAACLMAKIWQCWSISLTFRTTGRKVKEIERERDRKVERERDTHREKETERDREIYR